MLKALLNGKAILLNTDDTAKITGSLFLSINLVVC